MAYTASKSENELIDAMCSRNVNQVSCIGIMLTLKTEENFKKMLQWIQENPRAKQDKIIKQLDKICPEAFDYTPQDSAPVLPKRVRKIAAL